MPQLANGLGLSRARFSGGGFVGPLDDYTANLAGAWSVARRLLASYEGSLIRIRRSSDDAELDIGYNAAGALDTAAITSFVASNSAYVTKVYNQDASGVDFVNATGSTQPLIVASGVLNTNDGQPALLFDTTRNTKLSLGSALSVGCWITTAKLISSYDYPGLVTGSALNIIIGNVGGADWFTPSVSGASVFVNGVDKTISLTPFGFATQCFTVTGSPVSGAWEWGTERNIPGRNFDGPATEAVFYSAIPAFRADVETELMTLLGL